MYWGDAGRATAKSMAWVTVLEVTPEKKPPAEPASAYGNTKMKMGIDRTANKWNHQPQECGKALSGSSTSLAFTKQNHPHHCERRQQEMVELSGREPTVQHVNQRTQKREQCARTECAVTPAVFLRSPLLIVALLQKSQKQQDAGNIVEADHLNEN